MRITKLLIILILFALMPFLSHADIAGDAIEETELDTFAELQSQITDATLLKAGTLTDAQFCTWDNAGTQIVCNSSPSGSGDITDVGSCANGACAIEGGSDIFPFIFEGTADLFETTFSVTDPTADRSITFPDAAGEVSLLGQTISDAELVNNYSGVGACSANQFATTLNDNAAPTCSAITDADVPDTITVSNYLPLAGGTMTGALILDNLGISQPASDTNPTCGAGDYKIYSDLSDTKWKKCENGVVSDLDTGGGSGDITTVGNCTTGDCAIEGGTDIFPFIYEGTANTSETTFQATDPTADRTITFPDATGEVSLLGQTISDAEVDDNITASNYLPLSGGTLTGATTLDDTTLAFEEGVDTLSITVPALTAARAVTFPDAAGEISLLGQTISDTELVSNYSGVGSCTNQFVRATNDNAAPTCESITDTDVPDTITASNYLPLAGGTLTGALILDDTSLQIQEGVDTMTITVPALTAARAVTFPDAAGEISLLGQTIDIGEVGFDPILETELDTFSELQTQIADGTLVKAGTLTDGQFCTWDNAGSQILCNSSPSGSGDITAVGSCTTGDCAIEGGNDMFPFIYEGTANLNETTFQVTDPTADRTVTFPDAGGEVSLLGQTIEDAELASNYSGIGACSANTFATTLNDNAAPTCSAITDADVPDTITVSNYLALTGGTLTGALILDDTSLQIQEGVDTMTITVPALTAARAVTFPDSAGEISLLGQTISDAELISNYSGVGSCTNQFVRTLNDNAAPTCAAVGTADVSFDPIEETELDTIAELNTQITDATVLTKSDKQTRCFYAGELAAADDDVLMGSWFVAVTITDVWCNYEGTAPTTVAQISLEDGAGNAMTHTTPTCAAPGTAATAQSVTSAGGLTARENLRFDVDNTPNPATDNYTICVAYQIQ